MIVETTVRPRLRAPVMARYLNPVGKCPKVSPMLVRLIENVSGNLQQLV